MKNFLDDNFLLDSPAAERLYHGYAKEMPIIDYHCHLPPGQIASNHRFENITQAWLYGDHYKWRAMRTNGVDEGYCTGDKSDLEKFKAWAQTVPYTMRNPLYHWTHLELRRYFDIHELLNEKTAESVYTVCNQKLQSPDYSVHGLLRKMDVRLLCTTDDPVDDLAWHRQIKKDGFGISVLPAFRPDAAMNVDDPAIFRNYLSKLETISGKNIESFSDFLDAIRQRHDFFAQQGCTISDHGLEEIYSDEYTESELKNIFNKIISGRILELNERRQFKSGMLVFFAELDWEKSWVQQYHIGAIRNNNERMTNVLGPDTGWDSIGDAPLAKSLASFLNRMDREGHLTRTILYNLNPAQNEVMATMIGNYNDGSAAGKIQWGSAWWFLDQKDGMTKQLNALSNMGLLSRFIGMITDSRSFLSYPRHEYFRRLLCNLFGEEIEKGELPGDIEWIGKIVQGICFNNAKNYFGWPLTEKKS